jgi:alpha-mannosidase
MILRLCIFLLMALIETTGVAVAQNAYFVDGYHGGVYGHYPQWQTGFMADGYHANPQWCIGLEIEPETWDSVKVRTPEDYLRFAEIVGNPRVEMTNPTYAQPYCYNISGESIIRQFQYGMRKINEHFPSVDFVTYSTEEPCFTGALPQILRSLGFRYAVQKTPNTCWGGYMRGCGGELVNWIGPDGTSILTVPRYDCELLEEGSVWQTTAWGNSIAYLDACFDAGIEHPVGMTYQDAGWEKGPWLGDDAQNENGSIYVTWRQYIEEVSIGKTDDDRLVSQEDVQVSLMWGSQALQTIGRQVREAENKLVAAEKTVALARLTNRYTGDRTLIDEAWRTLMLSQHHDSWIVPYNRLNGTRTWADEVARWTERTNEIADKMMAEAMKSFENSPKADHTAGIRIVNTLGFRRREIVSVRVPEKMLTTAFRLVDADGTEIPYAIAGDCTICFEADVPPFGYATYGIAQGRPVERVEKQPSPIGDDRCILENELYRIVFDLQKGGTIKSLVAKSDNKEYVKQQSDLLLGEIRGFFYDQNAFCSSKDHPAQARRVTDNLYQTSLLITGEIASHPFSQLITVWKGQGLIDFDLEIDWKHNVGIGEYRQGDNWVENRRAFYDDRFKLNVLFPVDLNAPKLYKNAPFDVCESRLTTTFFNTWDSIKHNVALNWIDLSEPDDGNSLTLFCDHTTSYSYGEDFPLGLTIQYSGKGLWGWDYDITGPSRVRYALYPHRCDWRKASVSAVSSTRNEPLFGCYLTGVCLENSGFIDLQQSGYELSSVQPSDDGVIIRLFNAAGNDDEQRITFNFPFTAIEEIELNGERRSSDSSIRARTDGELLLSIPAFGLRTYRVKDI